MLVSTGFGIKVVRHIEMPKAAPKSPFVITKTRDDIEMK